MFDGVTKYFQFTVLPFGLSVGQYIFSKVMRPFVKYWRSKAIRIVVYLDDGIFAATNFSNCQGNSLLVRSDLFKSGFVANKDKCQWVPIQVICWLGICWDFKNKRLFIPRKLMNKSLHRLIECRRGWDVLLVLDADVLLKLSFWG